VIVVEACWLLNETRYAQALYDVLAPIAARNISEQTFAYGSGLHYLGLLATLLERWQEAEQHFADALAFNARIGARPFVARTQQAWATMFYRRSSIPDANRARSMAEAALTAANDLGMAALARQARDVLAALGTPAAPATPYGLSTRELEVLRLIVEGRSDREIAAELFISHRTVTRHVSNMLDKLGQDSRTAVATQAVREGIV
jgi:DNA-binding NarL/FixJ family response regulator